MNHWLAAAGLSVLLVASPCGAQSATEYIAGHLRFSNLVVEKVEDPLGALAEGPRRITGSLTNTGERTLTRVDVIIYYQDADGRDVGELELERVVDTENSSGDTSPLRPGYVRDFSTWARYAPSAWDSMAVRAEVSHVEFLGWGAEMNRDDRLERLRRDHPSYYDNIRRQIQRCFSWREGGSWGTTVLFEIQADGSATAIEVESRSGNADFDNEAVGAVECASRTFGPLPNGLDRLPVRFTFQPSNRP